STRSKARTGMRPSARRDGASSRRSAIGSPAAPITAGFTGASCRKRRRRSPDEPRLPHMRIVRDSEFPQLCDIAPARPPSFFSLPEWYAIVARHGLETGLQARGFADDANRAALICAVPSEGPAREIRSCINPYTCEYDWLGASAEAVRVTMRALAR